MPPNTNTVVSDYLVTPEQGRGAGVMVLHSGRGVTEFVQELCHRLARDGFVAMAPDMFDGENPTTTGEANRIKRQIDSNDLLRQLDDTAHFLRSYEDVSRREIAVIGIGFGAEVACELAPAIDSVCGGIVLFYGYHETSWESVTTPILGHFAELDHELPESRINEIRSTLRDNDIRHDLFMYPGAEPSFFETDTTARHDPESAQMARERTLQFLRNTLLGH